MAEFKNPFSEGDIIWWEWRGVPISMYYIREDGQVTDLDGILTASLEYVIKQYKTIRTASGPYRIEKAENWSGYPFWTES